MRIFSSKFLNITLAVGAVLAAGGMFVLYRREHPIFTEEQQVILEAFNLAVLGIIEEINSELSVNESLLAS